MGYPRIGVNRVINKIVQHTLEAAIAITGKFLSLVLTMNLRSTRCPLLLGLSFFVAEDALLPKAVYAETRTTTALTPEAVWDAITAAKDGDIVQLPEGTAVWKSGWNAKHWAKMKAITIRGAGIDKTIIRDETSTGAGDEPFDLKGAGGKPFRITGITFDGMTAWCWRGLTRQTTNRRTGP